MTTGVPSPHLRVMLTIMLVMLVPRTVVANLNGVCVRAPSRDLLVEEWDARTPDEICRRAAEFLQNLPLIKRMSN